MQADATSPGVHTWSALLGSEYVKAGIIVAAGVLAIFVLQRYPRFARLHRQTRLVIRKSASLLVLVITVFGALSIFGVSPTVLLGTAGILSVAIGFASQTSMSNVISGFFLMAERPFVVGDLITVGPTTGYVDSIDLLSVRLKTRDNLLVRIPNESLLKSEVTNLAHFPIRRYDLKVGVAYKEDVSRVKALLLEAADRIPICLEEPKPFFLFLGFGSSSLDLQFSVWCTQENHWDLRNAIHGEVKKTFDKHGIEIAFPHLSLYAGSATHPIPVQVLPSPQGGGMQGSSPPASDSPGVP